MSAIGKHERRALLIYEARRWLGVQEIGGNNRGQLVEIFQRFGGIKPGDPWCMAFVQACVAQVDHIARALGDLNSESPMPKGAHCLTVWGSASPTARASMPYLGAVAIWRKPGTTQGHAGIVTELFPKGGFKTIEGNTSPSPGVERDGDGVFEKRHAVGEVGAMELVGFILPWETV